MSMGPANPERLLLALDENLDHQVQLIIYGRSALWLGFDHPPAVAAATFDVDAIVPDAQVQALADDSRFWDARDAVNQRFKAEGPRVRRALRSTANCTREGRCTLRFQAL